MEKFDFLIVGAGIFGATAACTLRRRKYRVAILNPGIIPHPLAASTDISKVVRMEYGADREYMDMVDAAIDGWHAWNGHFKETLYHEAGFLMLCKGNSLQNRESFELASYQNLLSRGYKPEQLGQAELGQRFPAFNPEIYAQAIFNPRAGFADSGRVVELLIRYARELGVDVHQWQTAERFEVENGRAVAVCTREGERFLSGHILVCAGAYTPYLLPELLPVLRVTGHPVFHVQPSRPELFKPPKFSVFTSDISNSGWYGFPLHPREGVVKIGNHGPGQELHPERDERVVNEQAVRQFRQFLTEHIPELAKDPVIYTRRCLYSDTPDGHFWIDKHPEIEGLTVAAGGSGHAFKMAPLLGDLIADVAEGGRPQWSARHRWRRFDSNTKQVEEARYKIQ